MQVITPVNVAERNLTSCREQLKKELHSSTPWALPDGHFIRANIFSHFSLTSPDMYASFSRDQVPLLMEAVMDVNEAIVKRRSIRRYKPDPVPQKVLQEIIETGKWAANAMNTQPWEFAVLGGEKMKQFKAGLLDRIKANAPDESEIQGMPAGGIPEPYNSRAAEYRTTSDKYHFPDGTEDVDQKRKEHMARAGQAHDAPNIILIYTDRKLANWGSGMISFGALTQAICLAALKHNLGTCILGRAVAWPNMIRELLDIPQSKVFICGIAIGYPDSEARINNFPRTRMQQSEFVHWYGF
jgi:nitroreductase